MPKLIDTQGVKFVKTKAEVAAVVEKWREESGKTKKDFAELIGMTAETYNHVIRGNTYPNFHALSILSQNGFNIGSLLNLSDKDVAKIRKGQYDK